MTLTECSKRTAQLAITEACQQGWIVRRQRPIPLACCSAVLAAVIDCPHGVAPERMPKADATELAPKKSADQKPSRTRFVRAGGFLVSLRAVRGFQIKPISLVKLSERRPWAIKREDRPAAFAGRSKSVFWIFCRSGYRSCLHRRVSYPTRVLPQHRGPVTQERNPKMRQGKKRTPSGEKSVTRYNHLHFLATSAYAPTPLRATRN